MRASDIVRTMAGGALALCPVPFVQVTAGLDPDVEETALARLLGARYLLQVAVVEACPRRWVRLGGTLVELAHGASMLVLAIGLPSRRRLAGLSAVASASLAVADMAPNSGRVEMTA